MSLKSHGAQGPFPFERLTLSSHLDEISLSGPLTMVPSVTLQGKQESGASVVLALAC